MFNAYKADLHIHTVLSPCGDLEMSPTAIVERALSRGLDMIAISDHNTTRQVKVAQKVGKEKGLFVLGGVEVTSQEETHCLCYFKDDAQLDAFQEFLDAHPEIVARQQELAQRESELNEILGELKDEKRSQGFFNFSGKREVKERMAPYKEELGQINREQSDYEKQMRDYAENKLRSVCPQFTRFYA